MKRLYYAVLVVIGGLLVTFVLWTVILLSEAFLPSEIIVYTDSYRSAHSLTYFLKLYSDIMAGDKHPPGYEFIIVYGSFVVFFLIGSTTTYLLLKKNIKNKY